MGTYEKICIMDSTDYNIEKFHNTMVVESKYPELHWKGDARLSNLDNALAHINTNGLVLEFGVSRGTTINHIAKALPNQTIYGFDSFEGLPEEWQLNKTKTIKAGHFSRPDGVKKFPKVKKNVELIQGWFDTSLPAFIESNNFDNISFLHVDSDLYSSAKTIFDCLNSKINKGTVIVFDEFYPWTNKKWFTTWKEHEYKALGKWIKKYNRSFDILSRSNHCQTSIIVTN